MIKVQAGAAVHLARKRGEEVPASLPAIQEAGREAARELRATLSPPTTGRWWRPAGARSPWSARGSEPRPLCPMPRAPGGTAATAFPGAVTGFPGAVTSGRPVVSFL
ncbi:MULTISPECIES: histidine kinase dimerization/phosphoacceptor domain-containing protein [unclassified Nocardiopsis]|uniref:histidine kinase dimerization/phosphoacceptor domain-containing protein n=1 Tax=Nocardiopsis TaxID=2013 RepID=UPI00387A84AD